MGIFIGNTQPKAVWSGQTPIKTIYSRTTRVWPTSLRMGETTYYPFNGDTRDYSGNNNLLDYSGSTEEPQTYKSNGFDERKCMVTSQVSGHIKTLVPLPHGVFIVSLCFRPSTIKDTSCNLLDASADPL